MRQRTRRKMAGCRRVGAPAVGGAVLLDGLIAVLLFSIGILGMVGLQALSVKYAGDAKYRTDAALHADRLIAQMWGGAKRAGFAGDFSAGGAAFAAWESEVVASLPGADANPPTVAFNGSQVTIVLHWISPGDKAPHDYTTVS